MDGAARMFAAPTHIPLGGVEYEAKGRTVAIYAAIEQHLLEKDGPTPLEMVSKDIKHFADMPQYAQYLLDKALEETKAHRWVSREEINAFLASYEGLVYSWWLQIRHNDPEKLTLEYVTQTFWDDFEKAQAASLELAVKEAERLGKDAEAISARLTSLEEQMARLREVTVEIKRKLDQAGGEDIRGNSTGPTPPGKKTAEANTNPSLGDGL